MISDKNNEDKHFVAPYSKEVSFDELQDAPPSGKFRLSITGKLGCLLYTSPSPRDATLSRMPSSA